MIVLLLLGLCQAESNYQFSEFYQEPNGTFVIYGQNFPEDFSLVKIRIGTYDCVPLKSSSTSISCTVNKYRGGTFRIYLYIEGRLELTGYTHLSCLIDCCTLCDSPNKCFKCPEELDLYRGDCIKPIVNRFYQLDNGNLEILGDHFPRNKSTIEVKMGDYDCIPLRSLNKTLITCQTEEYKQGEYFVHFAIEDYEGIAVNGTQYVNATCPEHCSICESPDGCLECSREFYVESGTCKSKLPWLIPIGVLALLTITQFFHMKKYEKLFRVLEISALGALKLLSLFIFALNYKNWVLFVAFCLSFFYEIFIYFSYIFYGGNKEIEAHKKTYCYISPFVIIAWYFNLFPLFFYLKKKDQDPLFISMLLTTNIHFAVSVAMFIGAFYNPNSTFSMVLSCSLVYLYLLTPKVSTYSLEENNRGRILNYLRHLGDIFTLGVTFIHFSDLFGCLILFLVYRAFNSVFCLLADKDSEVTVMDGQFKLNKRMKVSVLILNYIGRLTQKHKWVYLVVTVIYYCVLVVLKMWLTNYMVLMDYLSLSIDFLILLFTWLQLGVAIAYECTIFEEIFNTQIQFRGRFKGWKSYLKIGVPLLSLIDEVTDIIYYFTTDFNSKELEKASLAFLITLPLVHFVSTVVAGFVIWKFQRRKGLAILACAIPITILWESKAIGIAVLFLQEIKQEFSNWVWIFLIIFELLFESIPEMIIQIINNQLTEWTLIGVLSATFAGFNNVKDWFTAGYYWYTKSPVIQVREPGEVSEDESITDSQALPEAIVFCLDNSEFARAQDYPPNRWQAQQEAAIMIATINTQSKPESTVGVVSMGQKKFVNSLTNNLTEAFSNLCHASFLDGKINLQYGLETARALLKNKPKKEHLQRIIAFVCSPVETRFEKLWKLGKTLRKKKIALNLVCFRNGDDIDKLEELVEHTNFQENSHLILVSQGILCDSLLSTPVIHGYAQPKTNALENSKDSEYTKAIKASLEQAKKRQELFELEEEQPIHQAIQLNIKENSFNMDL